jgi:hypothetical protein
MSTTTSTQPTVRAKYSDAQVGDHIVTFFGPDAPYAAGSNGHAWDGEVIEVIRTDERVTLRIRLNGRSLCADDLVYGFGRTRDGGSKEVIHCLTRPIDMYTHQRFLNRKLGRRYWSGHSIYATDDSEGTVF